MPNNKSSHGVQTKPELKRTGRFVDSVVTCAASTFEVRLSRYPWLGGRLMVFR